MEAGWCCGSALGPRKGSGSVSEAMMLESLKSEWITARGRAPAASVKKRGEEDFERLLIFHKKIYKPHRSNDLTGLRIN